MTTKYYDWINIKTGEKYSKLSKARLLKLYPELNQGGISRVASVGITFKGKELHHKGWKTTLCYLV